MGFLDSLKQLGVELAGSIKESYNDGSLGDSFLKSLLKAKEKEGKYEEVQKIKIELEKRREERRQESLRKIKEKNGIE